MTHLWLRAVLQAWCKTWEDDWSGKKEAWGSQTGSCMPHLVSVIVVQAWCEAGEDDWSDDEEEWGSESGSFTGASRSASRSRSLPWRGAAGRAVVGRHSIVVGAREKTLTPVKVGKSGPLVPN